jgi:hypothetical protein
LKTLHFAPKSPELNLLCLEAMHFAPTLLQGTALCSPNCLTLLGCSHFAATLLRCLNLQSTLLPLCLTALHFAPA